MTDTVRETRRVRLPEGKMPALRVEPLPKDTNQHGDVFGGWVMSQVDLAGGITAMRYCLSRKVVTRAVSSFTFENPIRVGDVVSVYTDIVKVGTSSITIKGEVYAERLTKAHNTIDLVTQATLVYVCLGPDGRPIPIEESRKRYFEAHPEETDDQGVAPLGSSN